MRANDINLKLNSVKSFENNVRKFCKIISDFIRL